MLFMETFVNAILENSQLAVILAALITAIGSIIAALISRKRQKVKLGQISTKEMVIIPPQVDPLSHLKSNLGGIKDIENMDPRSDEYYRVLAARLNIMKNDKTIIKIGEKKHD